MGIEKVSVDKKLYCHSLKTFGGAVLMDLSKAFDTIKHDLLIARFYAYGFNKELLKPLYTYLSNR